MSNGGADCLCIWLWIVSGETSNQCIIVACKAGSICSMEAGMVSKPHYLRAGRNLLVESSHARLKSGTTWLNYFRFFMILCLWFLDESKSSRILNLWKNESLSMSLRNGYRSLSSRSNRFDSVFPRQPAHSCFNDPFLGRADVCILWVSPSPAKTWGGGFFCCVGVSESALMRLWVRPVWVSHAFIQYPAIKGQQEAADVLIEYGGILLGLGLALEVLFWN